MTEMEELFYEDSFKVWEKLTTKNDNEEDGGFHFEKKREIWDFLKDKMKNFCKEVKEMKLTTENLIKENKEKELVVIVGEIENKVLEFTLSIYSILSEELNKKSNRKLKRKLNNEENNEEKEKIKRIKTEEENKVIKSYYFWLPNDIWRLIFKMMIEDGSDLGNIRLCCKSFRNLISPYWKQTVPISHLQIYLNKIKIYGFELSELKISNQGGNDILKEIPSNVKSLKLHSEIEDIDLLYLPSTIEILDIRNCTKLTDSCLSYLPDNLKNLNLFGLKNIKLESFTKLKNLNILFNYTRIDNYVTPLYLYCSKGKLEEVKNILNKIQYPDIK
jgi:hypothetical protein